MISEQKTFKTIDDKVDGLTVIHRMIGLIAKHAGFTIPLKHHIVMPMTDYPFFIFHLPDSKIIKSALAPDGFSVGISLFSNETTTLYDVAPLRGEDMLIPNIFG